MGCRSHFAGHILAYNNLRYELQQLIRGKTSLIYKAWVCVICSKLGRRLFVCLSVCLCICLSICLSVCLSLSVWAFVCNILTWCCESIHQQAVA